MDPHVPQTMRSFTDFESRQTRMEVRTIIPARVEGYNRRTQRAEISLMVKHLFRNERGLEQEITLPVLQDVPVIWTAGNAGYIHTGLSVGDQGLALVSDRSIAEWKRGSQSYVPYSPNVHNLADAMFLPGISNDVKPLTPTPASSGLTVEGSEVSLGATASRGVARLNDTVALDPQIKAWMTAVNTLLQTLSSALGIPFPPPGFPNPATFTDAGTISSASSKVKSE